MINSYLNVIYILLLVGICKWVLQICLNYVFYNYEIVVKLCKYDFVMLVVVCEWINSLYDGILNLIIEENECLKFEIWIFLK